MFAVPTDSLVLTDAKADFFVVATDLISQAEHGCYSTVWLVTDGRALAEAALDIVPKLIDDLPEVNVTMLSPDGGIMQQLSFVKTANLWRLYETNTRQNILLYRRKIWFGGLSNSAARIRFS